MVVNSITVYSSSQLVDTFSLSESGIDSDLFQILNIEGIDPVKASISTSSLAPTDGESITGEDVPSRNIVMTIRTNPDWDTYRQEGLRKELFDYFAPKNTVRLVFDLIDFDDLEIYGIVESIEANPFTQEPTFIVSIICPDPYFVKINPTIATGTVISPESWPGSDIIDIDGQVPVGFKLRINSTGFTKLGTLTVQVGDPSISTFRVEDQYENYLNMLFDMDSRPLNKYVRLINFGSGVFKNILKGLEETSEWPLLKPGSNQFAVMGDLLEGFTWEVKYFSKYSGL